MPSPPRTIINGKFLSVPMTGVHRVAQELANALAEQPVTYHTIRIDDLDIFYREAGAPDAPAILLPHGYPCSSYEFRNYMPALADRWHLLAPDFPGCGCALCCQT